VWNSHRPVEAGSVEVEHEDTAAARVRAWARENPARTALVIIGAIFVALIVAYGVQVVAQRTINGLVSGTYFALGAVGLTLVYGTLKLVNFAHGDFLTFGAYIAFVVNVSVGAPLVVALLCAVAATAALGVGFEKAMWGPMRAKKAGLLQLLLMAIGLAFLLRNGIQLFAGTQPRSLDVNVTASVVFFDYVRIGRTQLIVVVLGFAVLIGVALMLRYTSLGKQMRALSDNFDLAEVTGIDTDRIVVATWIFAAGSAGLAGVLYTAAIGTLTPNIGFFLLLSLFAAVILGGIGNAYGALAGGLVIGLVQEWSTLLVDSRWKVAIGFAVLILVLVIRPQGIFGRERTL
jgi:neutral amino acid transport system permease protein